MIFAIFSDLSADAISVLESSISALESCISALESEIKTLESSSICWERSIGFFTLLVVIGVALEFWAIFREHKDELDAWDSEIFWSLLDIPKPSIKKHIPEFLSVALVVAGVMGELYAGIKITSINGKLRAINAELQSKGSELRSKNDQLIALVTQDSAQLRKDAETERLKRVEIESKVAWRRLSEKEQSDLAAKIGTFPPNSVAAKFGFNIGDTEAATFSTDLANALKISRVVCAPPNGALVMPVTGKFGDPIKPPTYGVSVFPAKDEVSQKLADRLVKELNHLGFDSFKRTDPPPLESKFPLIELFVWPRPPGPQGEYKLRAKPTNNNQ